MDEPHHKRTTDEPPRSLAHAAAPIRRAYDLQGSTLAIASDDAIAGDFLEPVLAPLGCAPQPCDWIVHLRVVSVIARPETGRIIAEGTLPEGTPVVLSEQGETRSLVAPDRFAMHVSRARKSVEIAYRTDQSDSLQGSGAVWMLGEIVSAQGRHLLHGASVVDPETDEAIAIFAPSGTGKTTTVLALARAGFHLAGDDAMVLSSDNDRCWIWAVPRRLKVDRKTADMLPWLKPALSDGWVDGEQWLAREALSGLVTLAAPRRRLVRLVIVLSPPNGTAPAVNAMPKPDALAAIAGDNLRIAPAGVDADNTAALAALARLVAGTRVVALDAGPDPGALAADMFRI